MPLIRGGTLRDILNADRWTRFRHGATCARSATACSTRTTQASSIATSSRQRSHPLRRPRMLADFGLARAQANRPT